MKKIKTFLAQRDWDADLATQEPRIDKICWFILIVSALYYVPILIGLFLR